MAAKLVQAYLTKPDAGCVLRGGMGGDQGYQTQERLHQEVEANLDASLLPT